MLVYNFKRSDFRVVGKSFKILLIQIGPQNNIWFDNLSSYGKYNAYTFKHCNYPESTRGPSQYIYRLTSIWNSLKR